MKIDRPEILGNGRIQPKGESNVLLGPICVAQLGLVTGDLVVEIA